MQPVALLELVLLLVGASVVLAIAAQRLHVPPAVAFVIGGMAIGVAPGVPGVELDPELVMTLFLPPLLQASAFFTPWRDFRANLGPILLLAVGAVVFTTAAVGVALKLLLPALPWAVCFTLGAIVSPPDAVSAGAVLERLRIPRRLLAVLEGESLVNDASGLVLYRFGVAVAMGSAFDAGSAAVQFLLVAAGGIAIGAAVGWAQVQAIRLLRETNYQIAVSFLAAWGSYLAAEAAGVSSVLATVACGLVLGWSQHRTFMPETRQEARATWAFATFLLESMVFVLIGLSLRAILPRLMHAGLAEAALVSAAVTLTTVMARFVWVYPTAYLPYAIARLLFRRRIALGRAVRPAIPFAVSWAGMRGVVSLAAALALPEAFPGRDLVVFVSFAVIVGTVLVQGTTLGPLIHWLGIARDGEDGSAEEAQARAAMARAELRHIEQEAADPLAGAMAADLLEEYRDHADYGADGTMSGGKRAAMQAHLRLRLGALAAARTEVLRLQGAGTLHDTVLRRLERELDLQELRYRTTLHAIS